MRELYFVKIQDLLNVINSINKILTELFNEIWLSENNSKIFFTKEEVDSYLNSTLDDLARPTEYSNEAFRKVKLRQELSKQEIVDLSEEQLLELISYDPTQSWRTDFTKPK